jgi:isoleucyl-tRNA synthetase
MSLSQEILKRMSDSYRRMRNTLRFLLGNLHGFSAAQAVASADLVALDAWALGRTRELHAEIVAAYGDYQFHLIYQKIHNFCVVDLGGYYLDIIKDRLYTTPAASHARRSAQTALWHIAEAMVRWLAPILSFTAEEVWRFLPGAQRAESVFLSTWYAVPEPPAARIDWTRLAALRAAVAHELEALRVAGRIGAPLQAEVDVYCTAAHYAQLSALGDELRFLLITSQARVHQVTVMPPDVIAASDMPEVWLRVLPTQAVKCVRCWHHRVDVGAAAQHPQLCARCVGNLVEPGESRRFA